MILSPEAQSLLREAIDNVQVRWELANYIVHQPEQPAIGELIDWLELLKETTHAPSQATTQV